MPDLDLMQLLKNQNSVFASISSEFSSIMKQIILYKHKSMSEGARKFKMEANDFSLAFNNKYGRNLPRILQICEEAGLSEEDLFSSVNGYL